MRQLHLIQPGFQETYTSDLVASNWLVGPAAMTTGIAFAALGADATHMDAIVKPWGRSIALQAVEPSHRLLQLGVSGLAEPEETAF